MRDFCCIQFRIHLPTSPLMKNQILSAGLYLHAVTETELIVDTSRGEHLRINVMPFSLSLCLLSLDGYLFPTGFVGFLICLES